MNMAKPEDLRTDLNQRINAFYLYLRNYPEEVIAVSCGVSSRTVRNWIRDDDWKKHREDLWVLVRTMVLIDVLDQYRRDALLKDLDQARVLRTQDLNQAERTRGKR